MKDPPYPLFFRFGLRMVVFEAPIRSGKGMPGGNDSALPPASSFQSQVQVDRSFVRRYRPCQAWSATSCHARGDARDDPLNPVVDSRSSLRHRFGVALVIRHSKKIVPAISRLPISIRHMKSIDDRRSRNRFVRYPAFSRSVDGSVDAHVPFFRSHTALIVRFAFRCQGGKHAFRPRKKIHRRTNIRVPVPNGQRI